MENQTSGGKILPVVVAIILTALIVGGGMLLWQKGRETQTVSDNAAKPESPVVTVTTDLTGQPQTTALLEVGSISLQNPESIPACESVERQLPTEAIQNQFGVTSLLQNGYEMIDICREGNDKISFLLAKNEPNLLFEGTSTCLNACDRMAFGTVDFAKKDIVVVSSQHRLGIYAEAYNQFCRIDSVVSNGLFADTLFLYCGSGESGGFTNWYTYSFGDDNLTQVQNMTELGPPEVFDVKDSDLLSKFRYKSNTEMR